MSCFHVSVRLRVCSSHALSHLRALFHVGMWCSDSGTHVLSFVSGFRHLRSTFCLIVLVCGLEFARSSVHVCFVVLHTVRVFIGCVHSCYVLCCVARSLCFSLAACSCPVLHMAGDLFAGHVLVFLFCVSTWLLS